MSEKKEKRTFFVGAWWSTVKKKGRESIDSQQQPGVSRSKGIEAILANIVIYFQIDVKCAHIWIQPCGSRSIETLPNHHIPFSKLFFSFFEFSCLRDCAY
jgi:hypothetical protein